MSGALEALDLILTGPIRDRVLPVRFQAQYRKFRPNTRDLCEHPSRESKPADCLAEAVKSELPIRLLSGESFNEVSGLADMRFMWRRENRNMCAAARGRNRTYV